MSDYERIASAIEYIRANVGAQPGLAEIAEHLKLSPWHFQRLFSRWAGLTPKRFLQVVTVERAKRLLQDPGISLLAAGDSVGLSSSSRLQDHFISLEAMTPGEFRSQGAGLRIRHGLAESPFGRTFVAATDRGVCALSFIDDEGQDDAVRALADSWPGASLVADADLAGRLVERIFVNRSGASEPIRVQVRGTNFQVAVWRALLRIPEGRLVSYRSVAEAAGHPRAIRATGSAIGANPCAYLIPCHRVIRGNGEAGGYRWGLTRKQAINAWEAAASDGMLPEC